MAKSSFTPSFRFPPAQRQLRFGIVGGGGGGFIGAVHALAACMDNRYRLIAGAPSSRPGIARETGALSFLDPNRVYADYRDMAKHEAARDDGIEVVAITTPNHTHHAIARAFLDAGIHVICDKPLAATLADAADLVRVVEASDRALYVTHAFAAYPMIRQAREMIRAGMLGEIRLVHVEFVMDWLTEPIDLEGDRHASWRTDPSRSGKGGAVADIGTHAYHLARFVSGLEVSELSARLSSLVKGRRLDDNAHLLLRFDNGAEGTLIATQVAPGNECRLRIRAYGDKAGLDWKQSDCDHLIFAVHGSPIQMLGRGDPNLLPAAQRMSRVPKGHPEGYLEAFANLYTEIAVALTTRQSRQTPEAPCLVADVWDGALGVSFIEACVQSSDEDGRWIVPKALLDALLTATPASTAVAAQS